MQYKKLSASAQAPLYASKDAAGADLCADIPSEVTLNPGETVLIPTGIAVAIPEGFAGFVFARSGLSTKSGLAPANKVGVIDADYRGQIFVPIFNHSASVQYIHPQDRIAQLIILPVFRPIYEEASELPDTMRGEKGFGSTGRH